MIHLLFISSVAWATDVVTESELEAARACSADAAADCDAAHALFERVVVDGAALPDSYTPVVSVLHAREAGVASIADAADRTEADATMAAVLDTVIAYTGPDALPVEQWLFLYLGEGAVAAYEGLPGETGPRVAEALARPRRHTEDLVFAIDGACRTEVDAIQALAAAELTPLSEGWAWTPVALIEGRPPMLVELDGLRRLGVARCGALTDALLAGDLQPELGAPVEPGTTPGTVAAFEPIYGPVWPSAAEAELGFEHLDELHAYEEQRAALVR